MTLPTQFLELEPGLLRPLGRWLHGGACTIVQLLPAAPTPTMTDLMGFGTLSSMILDAQFVMQRVPDIRAFMLRDVEVSGNSHVIKNGLIVSDATILPPYVRYYYDRGLVPNVASDTMLRRIVTTPLYQVTNFNTDQYGHFLMECLPRLFITKLLYECGLKYPILISSKFPTFAREIAQSIHAEFQFLEYDIECEIVVAQQLLMPSMCHTHYIFHPYFLEFLRSIVTDALSIDGKAPSASRPARRIFVSRSKSPSSASSFRNLLNGEEIEAVAHSRGFEVVHPQELIWKDQAALFYNADFVIGEYGSGMHNALFSQPGTRILVMNWLNDAQQRIAQSCGHRLGFVMPSDGNPRWFSTDPNKRQDFLIDPGAFGAAVDNMLLPDPVAVGM